MVHLSPTLLVGSAGGLREGTVRERMTEKQRRRGIHVRKHLIKEEETKAEELKRSESREKEIRARQA